MAPTDQPIPSALVDQVRNGRVVLVLGAGASMGAVNDEGQHPPTAPELAQMLSRRFLGGEHLDSPLHLVGELAISETDLVTVQDYIRELFQCFKPADVHKLLPSFRWHGLATTNYDLVVEYSYQDVTRSVQELVAFRSDRDRVQDLLKSPRSLQFLKLHGCITRTTDPELPLILTPDQYVTHRKGRERLFATLKEWGFEFPLVFVGHRLQDSDIRQVLLELSELGEARPRYYLVAPSASDAEKRYWESRRITVISATFEDFLTQLDRSLPSPLRGVIVEPPTSHPISARFAVSGASLTQSTLDFLAYHADYVHSAIPSERLDPQAFFKGFNPGWSAVEQNLDVRRRLVDTILSDVVLLDEAERAAGLELHVIKAEAGAGKTVCLRRIAWDAAVEFDKLCIFLKPEGRLDYDPLSEIVSLTKERVFLFVDNAADNISQLADVVRRARKDKLPLTILTAERINEWNMGCDRLEADLTETHRLPYLSRDEIEMLVESLGRHRCLGQLESASHDERINAFVSTWGRQILVALHEATHGRPFEDILVDEYNEIQPNSARMLYLSVCVLHRLNVPVRAGLISRVHGIPFTEFRDKLFRPLEHVVQVTQDSIIKDYLYTARHALIADIVFDRILSSPNDRYDQYVRLIGNMNLSYDTDRIAFLQLMRARSLLELFPDHDAVVELFRVATQVAADDSFLVHQRGIYEMRRPNGSLAQAAEYLNRARDMAPQGLTILHSLAELELLRSEDSRTPIEKERHREKARELAYIVRADPVKGAYGYHTLLKISVEQLRELLGSPGASDREIDAVIQEIETQLESGQRRFSGDEYLLSAEADFSSLLQDQDRALAALTRAFQLNRRSPFIARSLAKALRDRGSGEDAIAVLVEALEANPGERRLHAALALALHDSPDRYIDRILYHSRRSFTPGDDNYSMQFFYASYLFMSESEENRRESKSLFKVLRSAPIPYELRTRIRCKYEEAGRPKTFTGRVQRLEPAYGFVQRDGPGDWIFMHEDFIQKDRWPTLAIGQWVRFEIGFNFFGPVALDVRGTS